MSKDLLKKIINVSAAFFALVFVLVSEVAITLSYKGNTSNPIYKGYFEFVKVYGEVGLYGFGRALMIIGFVLVVLCLVYYIGVLVLSLLKRDKIIKKLALANKIVDLVLIGSLVLVLISGFDKYEIGTSGMVNHISLFSWSWVLALVFSAVPVASKYLIKE